MHGFVEDIEDLAVKNTNFRRVLYTARHSQLVLMALKAGEEIGAEVHKLDQFFRVEEGAGEAILEGVRSPIRAGFAILVPRSEAQHRQYRDRPLKLYTPTAAESPRRRHSPHAQGTPRPTPAFRRREQPRRRPKLGSPTRGFSACSKVEAGCKGSGGCWTGSGMQDPDTRAKCRPRLPDVS
jgi:mannose-6-phosphate isomerase-like protein (cupin superfamily)